MAEKNPALNKYYQTFSGTDTLVYLLFPMTSQVTCMGSISTVSYSSYRPKAPVNLLGTILTPAHTYGPRTVAGTLIFTLINKNFAEELLEHNEWLREYGRLKADELPLFDLLIVSANEYGAYHQAYISGVSISDEVQVMSIEDIFTENQFSFVAKDYKPFSDFGRNNVDSTQKLNLEWDNYMNIPEPEVDPNKGVKIFLNGTLMGFIYEEPYIENGRTFIPVRDVYDYLGFPTTWLQATQEAKVEIGNKDLFINIKEGTMYGSFLGAKKLTMEPKPVVKDGKTGFRTFIPLAFFFESIGYNVSWDGAKKEIRITGDALNIENDTNLSVKDMQRHLNRHHVPKPELALNGIMDTKTKAALNEFAKNIGAPPITDFSKISERIREALVRPNLGVLYPEKEAIIKGTKKAPIIVYAQSTTNSEVIKKCEAMSQVTRIGAISGWYQISSPARGWVQMSNFE